MEIGEKIKALRAEAGLNRKEFAEHFGIPLRTVEDWEAGKRKPPEYIPRLIEYQIKNEQLQNRMKKGENTDGAE
ncbi:helix-turn-helix domain-containing protein [Anaerobium acetethylicum]|uniref:Helix-turn-helix n=1 Tax=Anaerobium acetethylicum TaxID=1619234 RepID=A0A1D3TV37_9FIRM|nr:helix-turn-helix domain-containing protein [Anaerobium acetethylicum]SCP98012.1 Helix-turn-helix [Anaerobium acetethylicum]